VGLARDPTASSLLPGRLRNLRVSRRRSERAVGDHACPAVGGSVETRGVLTASPGRTRSLDGTGLGELTAAICREIRSVSNAGAGRRSALREGDNTRGAGGRKRVQALEPVGPAW